MNKKISVSLALTIAIIAMTVTFSVTMILARQILSKLSLSRDETYEKRIRSHPIALRSLIRWRTCSTSQSAIWLSYIVWTATGLSPPITSPPILAVLLLNIPVTPECISGICRRT